MNRVSRALLGGLLVLLLGATNVMGAGDRANQRHRRRSSGGVLPGVTVTAIQTDTGFRREVVTDETGAFIADEPADRAVSPRGGAGRLPHLRADRHRAAGQQQPDRFR